MSTKSNKMIWLTYNSHKLQDGLGAQAQRILSIYLMAHFNGWAYYHTPLLTQVRGLTQETVDRFNQLITLPSTPLPPTYQTVEMDHFDPDNIRQLSKKSKPFLVKIMFAHQYLDHHPELISNPTLYCFDWVQTNLQFPLIVAIHIRRGDVSQTCNQERYISLPYYLQCMEVLNQILSNQHIPYQFHIYSEKSLLEEWMDGTNRTGRKEWELAINWHIDTDIVEAFKDMVNADLFLAGFSSLSYSVMMLRQKGCVLYPPFWHRYPRHAVCIKGASDIIRESKRSGSCLNMIFDSR